MNSSRSLGEILRWVIGAACLSLLLRTWLVMGLIVPVRVSGDSMEPSLMEGDGVLVDRTAYWFREPSRGDVVVFRCPHHPTDICVKRLIGLPAETVQLGRGQLLVDGEVLASGDQFALRYQDLGGVRTGEGTGARVWQLGSDEFFVMGDNAAVSKDSRSWAGLSRKLALGKALNLKPIDLGSPLSLENTQQQLKNGVQ